MKEIFKYLVVVTLLFCESVLFGQNQNMLKHFLTVEEGLSHNEVTSIVQDNDGFIWIGTRGGLNRYDGYEFKVFNQLPGDSNSLVNPSIETLFVDSKGNIWIGTKSGGVSKFDPTTGKFKNIINNYQISSNILPSNRVLTFFEDSKGLIWMGTWNNGLILYDEACNSSKHYLKGTRISSIVGTSENRIWVGAGMSDNLFEFDAESDSFIRRANIRCRKILYDEHRNVLWIVGGDNIGAGNDKNGLSKLDLRNNKISNYRIEDSKPNSTGLSHSYYSLHLDENGKVWIGTWGTGLYLFDSQTESFQRYLIYPETGGTLNRDYDAVLDIFEDRNNNIWLGTNGGGLCVLSDKLGFHSVGFNPEPNKGLINTRIMSLMEDKTGNLWIGTIGNGLLWTPDRENYYQVDNTTLTNKSRFFVIKYIFEDKSDIIWVGTNLGTYIVNFVDGFPQMVEARREFSNNTFDLTAVSFLDADNLFWIGTLDQGLYLLDKENYKLVKCFLDTDSLSNLKSDRISYLFQDSRDRIWIGTYNGLYVYNKSDSTIHITEDFFEIDGKFTGNIVTCIDEDQKGNLWIGTPNGLNKLTQTGENKFQLVFFTEKDGLSSNFIKGIARDLMGNIWVSTNIGISKYSAKDGRLINFTENDGVRGKNFTEASVYHSKRGEIFFGGTQGITYFSPDEIIEQQLALKPVFTELSVLNQPVEVGKDYNSRIILKKAFPETDEITLSYQQNKLEIKFSALDFESRGNNQYKYILENSDEKWNEIGTRRFIIFNNLKPGEYLLKVKSSNRHSIWNEEPAVLKIVIKPPFWQTWYALILYILVAVGIVTIVRWNAVKQVRLTNSLEMEKMQHVQDQKISEFKMQFFTNISHEFRTPLTLILAPLKEIINKKEKYQLNEELEHKINVVQNNSLRLMKLINQLLDFRKAETGNLKLFAGFFNLEDFVSEVCYPFYELAQINNIDFIFKSNLKNKEIWFDREKMEIIINNLVSNAFKFLRESGKIEVSLFEEEEDVLLSVSDNGPGINSAEIKHIFDRFYRIEKSEIDGSSGIGLAIAKQFVELHKGTILVTSQPGENTEFVVTLLKGNKHLQPDEMVKIETKDFTLVNKENILSNVLQGKQKSNLQSNTCILVVDDNEDVRNYLMELLGPIYMLETANNGIEGIEKVKHIKTDLIISDVMMPKMDGFEFCKKIRSMESTSAIPFIFLTAKSDEQFRLLGTQAGASDYISKPFDPNLLTEKVKNILERQKLLQKQYSKTIRIEPSDIEITSGEEIFIGKVISIIEKNLTNDNFTSEVLATQLNRSYSSLYRKLKKLTGLSTADFIRSIRIKRAAQLLADKEKTITQIAYEVGFNDVKHFRTVFQKQYICSPSEYRENL